MAIEQARSSPRPSTNEVVNTDTPEGRVGESTVNTINHEKSDKFIRMYNLTTNQLQVEIPLAKNTITIG